MIERHFDIRAVEGKIRYIKRGRQEKHLQGQYKTVHSKTENLRYVISLSPAVAINS